MSLSTTSDPFGIGGEPFRPCLYMIIAYFQRKRKLFLAFTLFFLGVRCLRDPVLSLKREIFLQYLKLIMIFKLGCRLSRRHVWRSAAALRRPCGTHNFPGIGAACSENDVFHRETKILELSAIQRQYTHCILIYLKLPAKWHIFLTNQGKMLLLAYFSSF